MDGELLLALLARPDPAHGTPGLSQAALDELNERHVVLGGTVDTAAQELRLLTEATALSLLGRATGLPMASRADITGLDVDSLQNLRTTLPRRLATAHGVCPLRLRGRRLFVACRCPTDMLAFTATMDELGFALALQLVPHVTTEALLALAWDAVYGLPVPARLQALLLPGTPSSTRLLDLVASDESGWSALSTHAPSTTGGPARVAPDAGRTDTSGWRIPGPGEVVLPPLAQAPPDRAALELIEDGTLPGDAPPAVKAKLAALSEADGRARQKRRQKVLWSEGDAVAELALCGSRDELLEVILRFTYRRVHTAAIFVKSGDGLVCFDVLDPLLEPRELRRFALPAGDDHVIGKAMALMSPTLGPVDESDPLCRLLGRRPRTVVCAPIVLSGRAIGAVVGDNDDKPIPAQLVGELQRVLPSLQRALTALIQKARTAATAAATTAATTARAATTTPAPEPISLPPFTVPPTPAMPAMPSVPPIPTAAPATTATATATAAAATPSRPPTTPPQPAVAPSPGARARESLLAATWRSWLQTPVDDTTATLVSALRTDGEGARTASTRLLALGLQAMPALAHAFPGPGTDPTRGETDGSRSGSSDDDGGTLAKTPFGATLARLSPDLTAPIVVGALDDPDPRRRLGAVALARHLRLEASVPGLGRRVTDADPRVARGATLALLHLRDAPGADLVRARLRDLCKRGHEHERRLAIRAVAALRDEAAVDALIDLVGTRPRELADEAAAALVELCRQDFGGAERRWRAWYTEHRHEPRRRWLLLGLTHKERALRAAAADELAEDGVALMGWGPDAPASERQEALLRLCTALGEPVPS